MSDSHLIDTAQFDIDFSSEELAFELQSELDGLIKNALMPVVQEVFDSSEHGDGVVRIPLLELDLGTVTQSDYRDELPRRLKEKLSDWFAEIRALNQLGTSSNNKIVDSETARSELVFHFLTHGYLPWNAKLADGETIEQRMMELIDSASQRVSHFLHTTSRLEVVIKRLVHQFSESLLLRVVQLLAPGKAYALKQYMEACSARLHQSGQHLSAQKQARFTRTLWFCLFKFLLGEGRNIQDSNKFLMQFESLLKQSLATDAQEYTDIIGDQASKRTNSIDKTIQFGDINAVKAEHHGQFKQFQSAWGQSLIRGDFSKIKPHWQALLEAFPKLMEAGLRHYGKQELIRKQLAKNFPQEVLHQILIFIEPREHAYISTVIREPELFVAGYKQNQVLPPPRKQITQQLWEYTLAYLLVERGSHFNKLSFLESLVRKMAASKRLSYSELLSGLSAEVGELANTNHALRQMYHSLVELRLNEDPNGDIGNDSVIASSPGRDTKERGNNSAYLQRVLAAAVLQGDFAYIQADWPTLVHKHLEMLQETLFYYGKQAEVRKQLAYRFPEVVLHDILKVIEPVEHGTVTMFIAQPQLFHPQSPYQSVNVAPPAKSLTRQLWEFTLTYMLVERGSQFNKKSYMASVVRQLAAASNLSQKVLLVGLVDHIKSLPKENRTAQALLLILEELEGDTLPPATRVTDSDSTAKASAPPVDASEHVTQLQLKVTEALLWGRFGVVKESWVELICKQHNVLRQSLLHYGQQIETRRRIVQRFPEKALNQILVLLEPNEHSFVSIIIKSPKWFSNVQSGIALSPQKVSAQLWEFTLAYLLVERGSHFNKKSYLSSLLQQMAAANNIVYSKLLAGVTQHLSLLAKNSYTANNMLQLLMEIKASVSGATDEVEVERRATVQQLKEYELYDQLLVALRASQDTHSPPRNTQNLVKALVATAPWLFMRLLRELQYHQLSPMLRMEYLPAQQLRQLVMALIGLRQSQANAASELVKTIESNSTQVSNLGYFYARILQSLLQDELIDFVAISADAKQQPHRKANLALQRESLQPADLENSHGHSRFTDDTSELKRYLEGEYSGTQTQQNQLIDAMGRLLDRHPDILRRLMVGVIAQANQLSRLIELLPEQLLSQLLQTMGMKELNKATLWAELLSAACYMQSPQSGAIPLGKQKWQVIFNYLAIYGRNFNESLFVSHFVKAMFKQSGIDNKELFYTQVAEQLKVNELPSTKVVTEKLVDKVLKVNEQVSTGAGSEASLEDIDAEEMEARLLKEIEQERKEKGTEILPDEDIYVYNAGMVVANPYIQRLFDMLGLLEGKAFKNTEAQERGVHILQYMVNESCDTAEHELTLNKLICGLAVSDTLEREIQLSDHEKETVDSLLAAIIQNWSILKNTSVAGLREAFLQREGRLQLRDDVWQLQVETKPYDMLLDKMPWGYSVIKYPWMERVIRVEWR